MSNSGLEIRCYSRGNLVYPHLFASVVYILIICEKCGGCLELNPRMKKNWCSWDGGIVHMLIRVCISMNVNKVYRCFGNGMIRFL